MDLALSQRLGRAFNRDSVTFAERDKVTAAAEQVQTFEQLPPAIRQLVENIESRPGPPPRELN